LRVSDRIFFHDNPWPKGHAIAEFRWWGRLACEGLFFELDLRTAKYSAEEPGLDSDASDWKAPIVWGNYHECHLHADGRGFRVATERKKLDFGALAGTTFEVDRKPRPWDEAAFHIYLLGHDSVARHRITFARRNPDGTFAIDWAGRICLSYAGAKRYEHSFAAHVARAPFDGIVVTEWDDEINARRALANVVPDVDRWVWTSEKGKPRFSWGG
jgi:hypothetical protein